MTENRRPRTPVADFLARHRITHVELWLAILALALVVIFLNA